MKMISPISRALLVAAFVVSPLARADEGEPSTAPAYFASPEVAVPAISKMLIEQDFATLARYYDLSGSGLRHDELSSGAFFVRRRAPRWAEPGEPWKYDHPFPTTARYLRQGSTGVVGAAAVFAEVKFGPESGTPPKTVVYRFYMRHSHDGWRVLPVHAHRLHGAEQARFLADLGPRPKPKAASKPASSGLPEKNRRRTHKIKLYWTTRGGAETLLDVTVGGARPSKLIVYQWRAGAKHTIQTGSTPGCDFHLVLSATPPAKREAGVTYVVATGEGTVSIDVFGFSVDDLGRSPAVTARYLRGGEIVGRTRFAAEPLRRR